MSEQQYTTVSIPLDAQRLTKHQLHAEFHVNKKIKCCTIQRLAVIAIVILLAVGFSSQLLYVNYKLYEATENYQILHADVANCTSEISIMKNWLHNFHKLSESDAYAANQMLPRLHRHLKRKESKFHCAESNSAECQYSESLGFFYSSHDVLEKSVSEFREIEQSDKSCRRNAGTQVLQNTGTGQIWCNNTNRDDSFYNRYFINSTKKNDMDSHPYNFLGPAKIMLQGRSNLDHHKYYYFEKGSTIIIKQSGIYMIFSKVTIDVSKGTLAGYGVWKNSEVVEKCRLSSEPSEASDFNFLPCPTFTVAYLNEADKITMRVYANTRFLLGETNFFIGLLHMTSLQLLSG